MNVAIEPEGRTDVCQEVPDVSEVGEVPEVGEAEEAGDENEMVWTVHACRLPQCVIPWSRKSRRMFPPPEWEGRPRPEALLALSGADCGRPTG